MFCVCTQILDLEQQLKKQAGENKKFMPEESNPLPQIDGLADDETKKQQTQALQSMIEAQTEEDQAGQGGAPLTQDGVEPVGNPQQLKADLVGEPIAPVQEVQAEEPEVEPEKIVESEPVNNYDDMFYENLLQTVRDNPEA